MRILKTLVAVSVAFAVAACSTPAAPPAASTSAPATAAPKPTEASQANPAAAAPTSAPAAAASQAKPASTAAPAAAKPTTAAEIVAYRGADREQVLYEGAKKEGTLNWYTSITGDIIPTLAKAFKDKYPGIEVKETRLNSDDVVVRVSDEYQAKKYIVDVLEAADSAYLLFAEQKILLPYWSPALANMPDEAKQAAPGQPDLVQSAMVRVSYIGYGYNTTLLPENAVPKTYQDLASPALKGKMCMSGPGSTGSQAFGGILQATNADWVRTSLWPQNYRVQEVSARAVLDLVVSGECPASPTLFQASTDQLRAQGAPVKWIPLDPVPTFGGAAGILSQVQHPYGAALFADFLLSPEGQKIYKQFAYGSAGDKTTWKSFYPAHGVTAAQFDEQMHQWEQLMRQGAGKS